MSRVLLIVIVGLGVAGAWVLLSISLPLAGACSGFLGFCPLPR